MGIFSYSSQSLELQLGAGLKPRVLRGLRSCLHSIISLPLVQGKQDSAMVKEHFVGICQGSLSLGIIVTENNVSQEE